MDGWSNVWSSALFSQLVHLLNHCALMPLPSDLNVWSSALFLQLGHLLYRCNWIPWPSNLICGIVPFFTTCSSTYCSWIPWPTDLVCGLVSFSHNLFIYLLYMDSVTEWSKVWLSRDRTSVGHGDDGLDAITSNQRINTTLCKNKNKHVFKKFKKKKTIIKVQISMFQFLCSEDSIIHRYC